MTTTTVPTIEGSLRIRGITTDPKAINAARHLRAVDRLWVCDLSQIWGGTSWLYFAFVLDHASGRCLGWSPHRLPHPELVAHALTDAVAGRLEDVEDQRRFAPSASADVPVVFGRGCRTAEIDFPRWAIASASDAARCTSFVAALRRELVDEEELGEDRAWASVPEAQRVIADWIEFAYNARRATPELGRVA